MAGDQSALDSVASHQDLSDKIMPRSAGISGEVSEKIANRRLYTLRKFMG